MSRETSGAMHLRVNAWFCMFQLLLLKLSQNHALACPDINWAAVF
jgi:hypothetical protein